MNKFLSIMAITLLSTNAFAGKEDFSAIYGSFDNKLVNNTSVSQAIREEATGVGMVLRSSSIENASSEKIRIRGTALKNIVYNVDEIREGRSEGLYVEPEKMCKNEMLVNETVAYGVTCSSFLISETEVLTAGHCVYDMAGVSPGSNELSEKTMCERMNFVFGVNQAQSNSEGFEISKANHYKCGSIMKLRYEQGGVDFAIIRLNRPAKYRNIFELGNDLALEQNDATFMYSYPIGLSLTYTANSNVVSNYDDVNLKINVDAFGGSSGAPVLSKKTGKVIGILTGGGDDFEMDSEYSCKRFARYDNRFGERVLRISAIRKSK